MQFKGTIRESRATLRCKILGWLAIQNKGLTADPLCHSSPEMMMVQVDAE